MRNNRFYFLTMTVLVLALGYLTYKIVSPFLAPIAWAIVLSILFYPLYAYLLRFVRWKGISSFIVLLVIIILIVGPFSYVFYLLVSEVQDLTGAVGGGQIEPAQGVLNHPMVRDLLHRLSVTLNISMSEDELRRTIVDNISRVGKELAGRIPGGIGNVMGFLADFVLMAFSTFFILKDGSDFIRRSRNYLPFSEEQKVRLAGQIKDIIVSTIYGGVVVALVQGVIGGVAYALLGTRSPVLWGLTTAVASFIPMVGTFAVWGVIALYFLFKGAIGKAVAMLLIGVFGISMIDNVLKPILIGARTRMHILVIFFSVLGGIGMFGLIGLVMGPLVVALFFSVLEIFRNFEGGQNA